MLDVLANWASILGFVWPLILGIIGFLWGRRVRQRQLQRLARHEVPRLLTHVQGVYHTMPSGPSPVGEAYLHSLAADAAYLAQVHRKPRVVHSHLGDLQGTLEDATTLYYEWEQLPDDAALMRDLRVKLRRGQHLLETLDLELLFEEEV